MKVLQTNDLYLKSMNNMYAQRGRWEANWIYHKEATSDKSGVYAYLLKFTLNEDKKFRIHVSADNRYKLYIDGKIEGFGPERGDNHNWFFESYDLDLKAGEHTIFAFTWFMTQNDNRNCAQFSFRPGFILCSEDLPKEILNTGFAPWKTINLTKWYGLEFDNEIKRFWYVGNRFTFHGEGFPIGYENGEIGSWEDPFVYLQGEQKLSHSPGDYYTSWWLCPATLPIEYIAPIKTFNVRHGANVDKFDTRYIVKSENNDTEIINNISSLLNHNKSLTIAPNKKIIAIVDLDNYYCTYIKTNTTGGKNSKIYIDFAEGLFEVEPQINKKWDIEMHVKNDRNAIENKFFEGYGDHIYPGGQKGETFECPWWNSGRYVQIYIETKYEPLTINSIDFTECHYNYTWQGDFKCNDKKFTDFIPLAKRCLEMCTHETYMDCPYYEQLMYVGDTRVEALATFAWEKDRYIQEKALDMFHASIRDNGLTQSRYPSFKTQFIPPFSLWYIAFLYDYAMWGDNLKLIKSLLPDANGIIEFFLRNFNQDGLLQSPHGWNFLDWSDGFNAGMTETIDKGVSGQYNIHLIYTLDILAKLEDILNEPELATRHRRISNELYEKVEKIYWDEERGLFADNKEHTTFLEHTQCIAILSDHGQDKVHTMLDNLYKYDDIYRTTIYYSFYLHEACRKANRFDIFDKRISFWSDLVKQGFKTTPECPEPARSDCHAWGAHPLYHLQTGILGIEPNEPCFKSVKITPRLLDLKEASGTMPHKLGNIKVSYTQENNETHGTIILPNGLDGICNVNGKTVKLTSGENKI